MATGGGRQACGLSGGGGLLGQEAGSTKEIALLKAVSESLRAGLREKEDSITELVSVLQRPLGCVAQLKRIELCCFHRTSQFQGE